MPYSRSRARDAADRRARELANSLSYAKKRTRMLPTHIRDVVCHNAIFQLSAVLEDYNTNILTDWVAAIIRGTGPNSCLPEYTRAAFFALSHEKAFRRFAALENEVELVEHIIDSRASFELLDPVRAVAALPLSESLMKGKKFPSTRNFDPLFRRFGLKKMSSLLSAELASDFSLALQSFMDIRNAIAHEAPPAVTVADAERHLRNVRMWLRAMDRIIYSHISRTSGNSYWTRGP